MAKFLESFELVPVLRPNDIQPMDMGDDEHGNMIVEDYDGIVVADVLKRVTRDVVFGRAFAARVLEFASELPTDKHYVIFFPAELSSEGTVCCLEYSYDYRRDPVRQWNRFTREYYFDYHRLETKSWKLTENDQMILMSASRCFFLRKKI